MQGQVQQFASQPQAVTSRKYRSPDDMTLNMMYDKRVVRGNTYASMTASPQPDAAEVKKQREAQRRRLMRANQTKKRVGTPEPVAGRKHMDIQTDSYLEELTERTVEFEAETQTDFILDRPPSPLFMPAKIGVDTDTQIEEGELFDFDVEVEPVLEVLVGKTLEQSMMEVLEEEELASLRRYQEDYRRRRDAELQEVQRMEAAEQRRQDEMERRMQQQAAQRKQDLSVMRKVVSRSIAEVYLSTLKDRCLAHLLDAGNFADSTQLAVDSCFMPTLLQAVVKQMDQATLDRAVVTNVLSATVTKRLQAHGAHLEVERRRLAQIDQAEREAREEKEEEQRKKAEDLERIHQEQAAMCEWEAYMPPPPVAEPEVHILSLNEESLAVYGDGLTAVVPEDKLEELKGMLAAAAEGEVPQIVLGRLAPAMEGAEGEEPRPRNLDTFRLGTEADLAAEVRTDGGEALSAEDAA